VPGLARASPHLAWSERQILISEPEHRSGIEGLGTEVLVLGKGLSDGSMSDNVHDTRNWRFDGEAGFVSGFLAFNNSYLGIQGRMGSWELKDVT